ncbi:hypothetical protein [Natrinema sp. DC36]|uniref:DUF7288 family protein n=1 Tax=Natrinema sp. DC36 TaxID=2878680 RepID=UPI001CEFDA2E|nr:hypothetical protein [Natrinema sp. DC36]
MPGIDIIDSETDRGQAYTLEGFIGAMVVLMAVLFALQSVVIMPTTGGLADRSVQAQIQQEVQDALVVSNQDGNLSETIRRWNESDGGFEGANQPEAPGEDEENQTYSVDRFANESELGQILKERFAEKGWSYNVELHPESGGERTLVYQGSPPASAQTASYTVTLYDNQSVTSESGNDDTLEEAESDGYAVIPREHKDDTPLYNVVEIRVILW